LPNANDETGKNNEIGAGSLDEAPPKKRKKAVVAEGR